MTTTTTPRGLDTDLHAWREVFLVGLLFGGVALYVTLVGLVGAFEERDLIANLGATREAMRVAARMAEPKGTASSERARLLNKCMATGERSEAA